MKLHILLTCEDFFPVVGGAEVCVANIRRILKTGGHSVTLFTNTTRTTADEEGIVRLQWSFRPVALTRHWSTLWNLIAASDIVHCQYSFRLACLCGIIARLQRKPMVLTQQGKGIVPEARPKFHHFMLYRLCQIVSMRTASVITSTSDEITDLTAAFVPRSKIVSVTNGYDKDRFSPDPTLPVPTVYAATGSSKKILTVRRIVPKNGIHILIQALALVKKVRSDFHYIAIGDGRTRPFVESLIVKHDLTQHVTLMGALPNDTIKAYYQHADLVIVPSSAEATSIACIEAMGMEKPLIASRVGGLIDLLGKTGEYGALINLYGTEACTYNPPDFILPERLQALADTIIAFLLEPEPFRQKAIKAAVLVRAEYSWDTVVQKYMDVYSTVLPASHASR